MTERGWNRSALAREAKLSAMTVGRFLDGAYQTEKTAKAIAEALGKNVKRYIAAVDEGAVA